TVAGYINSEPRGTTRGWVSHVLPSNNKSDENASERPLRKPPGPTRTKKKNSPKRESSRAICCVVGSEGPENTDGCPTFRPAESKITRFASLMSLSAAVVGVSG